MAVYSQRQVGITFHAVLEDITDPSAPAPYDPLNADDPAAPRLVMLFRRPDGLVLERPATRADRTGADPKGAANDDNISWTSTPDDPLIAGLPGVWHRTARAVSPDGQTVVESPDWLRFEVV